LKAKEMPVHKCEFCYTEFKPRPQVKSPRACSACQRARQRDNEYNWRKRNPKYSSAQYHELRRNQRNERLKAIALDLSQCIRIGKELTGVKVEMAVLGAALTQFLVGLGIRRINKFWVSELAM
jgi:hypothetical protein